MTLSTIATEFLVISDTHNLQFDDISDFQPLPKADVLLHCGDLTQVGGVRSFKKALSLIKSFDADLKLVIAGNHDLELDKTFWKAQCDADDMPEDFEDHDLSIKAMRGALAKEAGATFLDEGTHTFKLNNGAVLKIYVSPYTPAFGDWAFAYAHDEDRFNKPQHVRPSVKSIAINPIPDDVDVVMTHGPPKDILDHCADGHVGCPNLLQALRRVRPAMHCFGHIHEGHGAKIVDWGLSVHRQKEIGDRIASTILNNYPQPLIWNREDRFSSLAVNAAIMTGDNKPENAPWLVKFHLPASS